MWFIGKGWARYEGFGPVGGEEAECECLGCDERVHGCERAAFFPGVFWADGNRVKREFAGISTVSARAKRSSQEPGLRERMTSPVSGSLRMNTSGEEKRKSEGKRTAWLRPFLKSLAILRMTALPGA